MPDTPLLDLAVLNERMCRGPFHKWLGIEAVEAREGELVVEVPWRSEFIVNPEVGYAHGGILAAIIDSVADWVLATKLGRPFPTIDLRVDYHRPATEGPLRATGTIIRLGSTFSTCEAVVQDPNGKLLASGRGTFATKRG